MKFLPRAIFYDLSLSYILALQVEKVIWLDGKEGGIRLLKNKTIYYMF